MSNSRRQQLITKVVKFEGNPFDYFNEIRSFGWDCEEELVVIARKDIVRALDKFEAGEKSDKELGEWANFLECREDIRFESVDKEILDEVIFWLANPYINYKIDKNLVYKIKDAFENGI